MSTTVTRATQVS